MKKCFYRAEILRWFALVFFLGMTALEIRWRVRFPRMAVRYEDVLMYILAACLPGIYAFRGFRLMHIKRLCLRYGEAHEGHITGYIRYFRRSGDLYSLVISCRGGDVITPKLRDGLESRLRSKKCVVYRYRKYYYACGYELCGRKEKGIYIPVTDGRSLDRYKRMMDI